MESLLTWYLPTLYGDIRLESKTPEATTLLYDKLSPSEVEAMASLRTRALSTKWGRKPWSDSFPVPVETGSGVIDLDASIDDVQKLLAKALKPGRVLVTAVRFGSGAVEEKREGAPYRTEGETTEPPAPAPAEPAALAPPKVAATVAAPVRGCPPPDFDNAEVRATRVLEAFLLPEQLEDFRRHGQFMSVGRETQHRYLVTSRFARQRLRRVGGRSLYDLDEPPIFMDRGDGRPALETRDKLETGMGRAFCVHDWTVPAAEEMLAIHLFLSLPGYEHYLRDIPDVGEA